MDAVDLALTALRRAGPGLLYGLRVSAAVSIALAIAFALQLENPSWSGTTAALVCQPVLGSSLRKGLFRSFGTLAGALATVLLFALFPQDRVGFTLGMAGWCALCGFAGSRLSFFAAYGALLAGYTAAILTGDLVDNPDQTFDVTLARVTEIQLGIVVATVVLTATQSGGSRQRLADGLRGVASDAAAGLVAALAPLGTVPRHTDDGRALLTRLFALDAVVDQVAGEAAHWRFRLAPVRAGQDGLFACIAEAQQLRDGSRAGLDAAWRALPLDLRRAYLRGEGVGDLRTLRDAAAALLAMHAPDQQAVRDAAVRAGTGLAGAAAALEVAAWLNDASRPQPRPGPLCTAPADPLPALVNAARAFVAVAATMAAWMATRWPNGPAAVTFTAVVTLLMAPQQEAGFKAAAGFTAGAALVACLAAIVKFALLPQAPQAMWGLAAVLALFLVPLAALSTIPRLTPVFGPAMMNFIPLVSPANEISYDTAAFYNSGLAIVGGCLAGAVVLRVVAPLPVPVRIRRTLAMASAEGAAVASGAWRPTAGQWADRMRTRAAGLPAGAGADAVRQVLLSFTRGAEAIRARAPGALGGVR